MDRNNVIGILLIFGLFYLWMVMNAPSDVEIAEQKRVQDSIALVEAQETLDKETIVGIPPADKIEQTKSLLPDSIREAQMNYALGPFSNIGSGDEQIYNLENELIKVSFSNKGGNIKEVTLKNYKKVIKEDGEKHKVDLKLLNDEKDKFEYLLPITTAAGNVIKTSDLYFKPILEGNTIKFRADAGEGKYLEQEYTLNSDSYELNYDLNLVGMHQVFQTNANDIKLNWVNYLDRLEINTNFEKYYSTVYFKTSEDDSDYCSCRGDAEEDRSGQQLDWVSHANQFFNTSLIAGDSKFSDASFTSKMTEDNSEDMKILTTNLSIPFNQTGNESFSMKMFIGPNEFDLLEKYDNQLEQIVPFGRSIFGTINRYIIRPLFDFLFGKLGSVGLAIIIMITIIKFILYPLTYKMLHSQAKMGVLKPEIAHLKEKFKDEPQKIQMETMKIYREFGVSPLGGCMPMLIQMPIWYAMFRFFPAYINFRQEAFLWADDLSSYDVFVNLPWEIPMFGAHISLFTLLWAVTTVIYTYYNTKHMDMSAQPMMKYMQYGMPIMFLVFFNNYASGLTIYMFFSNLINIFQTIGTKKWIFNDEKIKAELFKNKEKPKKKSKFQSRLEDAMNQQQKMKEEKNKKRK
jgi:YidC/Oxa1 family membrane protein insertase